MMATKVMDLWLSAFGDALWIAILSCMPENVPAGDALAMPSPAPPTGTKL